APLRCNRCPKLTPPNTYRSFKLTGLLPGVLYGFPVTLLFGRDYHGGQTDAFGREGTVREAQQLGALGQGRPARRAELYHQSKTHGGGAPGADRRERLDGAAARDDSRARQSKPGYSPDGAGGRRRARA